MQIKKKDYVAISSFSWFNEEWDWFPALGALTFPQCYSHTIPRKFYLECRSQSQLLKDKRLNKYWAVWIVTCKKDVHTRVSIERWIVLMGCQNASACNNTETSVIWKTDQCKHHLCLKNITSVEVLRCLGLKRFRTYCLLCHNKVGLAAA